MKTELTVVNGRKYAPIEAVLPDPNQPRKAFDEEKLKELAASIRENGIIVDLLVVPMSVPKGKFQLIDGERRWRAAKLAGLQEVPISERNNVNARSLVVVQSVANQQHENLSALEEAAAWQRQIDRKLHTPESLYRAMGISRAKLFARLALNRLSGPVRQALTDGKISVSVAGLVAMVPGEKNQLKALADVGPNKEQYREAPLSFRDAREAIEEDYCQPLNKAPFDTERIYEGQFKIESTDGKLSPVALRSRGACKECPYRSGNLEGVEVSNPNICTEPRCYGAKAAAHAQQQVMKAEEAGKTVLPKNQSKGIFNNWNPTSPQGAYLDLGEKCWEDKKQRTYREILGKEAPAGVMAFNGNGRLQQVWEKKQVAEALKKKGIQVRQQAETSDYAKQEEQKILNAVALKALPAIREKLKKLPAVEALRVSVVHVCNNWQFLKSRGLQGVTALEKKAASMKEEELRMMLFECGFSLHEPVEDYSAAFDSHFQDAAKLAGVDLKAMVAKEKAAGKPHTKGGKGMKGAKGEKGVEK